MDNDAKYPVERLKSGAHSTRSPEPSGVWWYIGAIVAMALLAIAYIVSTADSTSNTPN